MTVTFHHTLVSVVTESSAQSSTLARIEQAKQAVNDQAQGRFNIEIVDKLQRNLEISPTKVERYHVYHQGLPQGQFFASMTSYSDVMSI